MRSASKSIIVTLDGQDIALKLHFGAVLDFETVMGMSVTEFLRPIVPVLTKLWETSSQAGEAVDKEEVGLQMLDDLLAAGTISGFAVTVLAWALAGGTDRIDPELAIEPPPGTSVRDCMAVEFPPHVIAQDIRRNFAPLVGAHNAGEFLQAIMKAVQGGMPEADEDAEDEEFADTDEADADPTPSPQ